jgi:hypothetical protein
MAKPWAQYWHCWCLLCTRVGRLAILGCLTNWASGLCSSDPSLANIVISSSVAPASASLSGATAQSFPRCFPVIASFCLRPRGPFNRIHYLCRFQAMFPGRKWQSKVVLTSTPFFCRIILTADSQALARSALSVVSRVPPLQPFLSASLRSLSPSNASQAGVASTMLTADSVGTTRVRWKPALPSSAWYSCSVRSCPPGPTSIIISSILPG